MLACGRFLEVFLLFFQSIIQEYIGTATTYSTGHMFHFPGTAIDLQDSPSIQVYQVFEPLEVSVTRLLQSQWFCYRMSKPPVLLCPVLLEADEFDTWHEVAEVTQVAWVGVVDWVKGR